jgi:hypothetical protein
MDTAIGLCSRDTAIVAGSSGKPPARSVLAILSMLLLLLLMPITG